MVGRTYCDVAGEVNLPSTLKIAAGMSFFAILNILTSFCGTLANGLVITAYYRNPRLRSIQNTIFFLLAITDISVTSFVQPTYAAAVLREVLGSEHCLLWDIVALSTMAFIYLSLVTMVILSLQSYVTLAYPYHYQSIVTMRRLRITVICSWIFILVTTFSVKFNSTLEIYLSLHNILDYYNRDSYLDLDMPTRSSTSKSNSKDTNSFNS